MTIDIAQIKGPLPARLANTISDTIVDFNRRGMGLDEICSVVVAVVADYGRKCHGNEYVESLAIVMVERCAQPLPAQRIEFDLSKFKKDGPS